MHEAAAGPDCVCIKLLRIWRRHAHAVSRRCGATAGIAVRRFEACRGTALLPVSRELRAAHGVAAVLHGVWPPAAAGYGLPQVSSGDDSGRADYRVRRRRTD